MDVRMRFLCTNLRPGEPRLIVPALQSSLRDLDNAGGSMKTNMLVVCFALLLSLVATGQQTTQTKTNTAQSSRGSQKSAVDQALQERMREYTDALTKRDLAALDKIWASDYTFINPRGELVTKAQRMENIKSGATEFQAITRERERLQVHGNVAVVIGRVNLQGTKYGGQESSGEYRFTNVWVKMQGRWQLVANQVTRIAK